MLIQTPNLVSMMIDADALRPQRRMRPLPRHGRALPMQPLPPSPKPTDQAARGVGDLLAANYPALKRMAAARALGTGISPTSLVNDAACRLLKLPDPPTSDASVQALAHQLLEWSLIDKLRKAAGRRRLELAGVDDDDGSRPARGAPSLSLCRLLDPLAALDPRKAEVVLLWAVGNLSMKQIAVALSVSEKTVQRDLDFARAWLSASASRGPR